MVSYNKKSNILKKIIISLKSGKKTLLEISKEVYNDKNFYDKKVVEKYLESLIDAGIVNKTYQNEKTFYTLDLSYNKKTLFGLPLNEHQEKTIHTLFFFIKQFFKNKNPSSTLIQKVVFEIAEKYPELNIPHGWYLYGGTSIIIFDEKENYENKKVLSKKIIEDTKKIVKKYSKYSSLKIRKEHYEKYAPIIYNIKEEILKEMFFLPSKKTKEESLEKITFLLKKFLKEIKDKEGFLEIYDYFDSYLTLTKDILRVKTNFFDEIFFSDYILLFNLSWRFFALTYFKENLKEYYNENILNEKFNFEIKNQEEEIKELGTELQSIIPEDETEKKLREAIKKIKLK